MSDDKNERKFIFETGSDGVVVFDSIKIGFETTFQEDSLVTFYAMTKNKMRTRLCVLTKGDISNNSVVKHSPVCQEII